MVRATWDPPASNGGSPLLSYTATLSTPTTLVTNTVPAGGSLPMAEVVFGKLDNDVGVTISVIATNADGDSTPVVSSMVTPVEMPGQLPNVITYVMGLLAWNYQNLVLQTAPRMRFGKKYLSESKDAPRVVFVPKRAEILGPEHWGTGAPGSPRQLWTRRQHVTAYCWGAQLPTSDATQDYIASYGQAEFLLQNVAASIHEASFGAELAYSDEYVDAQDNETRGVGISLDFSFFLPITEIPVPPSMVALLTDFDQSNDI